MAGQGARVRKTMPQGTVVGRPQSSPLMKFAMRTRKPPIGSATTMMSPRLSGLIFLTRAKM